MKTWFKGLVLAALSGLLLVAFSGCAQPAAPTPPPAAIQYQIGEGAAIASVNWYMQPDKSFAVQVEVKNTTSADKKFVVAVQVDDEPLFICGADQSDKVVAAGKTLKYTTQFGLTEPLPKKLSIQVTPK